MLVKETKVERGVTNEKEEEEEEAAVFVTDSRCDVSTKPASITGRNPSGVRGRTRAESETRA